MIARTLVPENIRPAAPEAVDKKPRRRSTWLDSRTVVPADLPVIPLEGRSAIPLHVPLEVLAARTVVPRDIAAKPLPPEQAHPPYVPLSILDARVVVPSGLPAEKLEISEPVVVEQYADILEPDIITTGEANLLPRPVEARPVERDWVSRASSVVFHLLLIVFLLYQPKLFPTRPPTQQELEIARRQLSFIYLPPGELEVPKVEARPQPPSAQIRVDPRVLRMIAPPNVEPSVNPGAQPAPQPELPNAPRPPVPQSSAPTPQQTPGRARPAPRLESPQWEKPPPGLVVPQMSPGRALEESVRGALQGGVHNSPSFADPLPPPPSGNGVGAGGGQGYLGGALEMLTPDQGVDFTNYFARLLASVRRNWYAVIPESARMGERGRVMIQFRILQNGSVPYPEPVLVSSSGKEPLDRAAMSAIHASSPFEPLPPAFSGPYIELRFIFLYNLPLDYR